MDLANSMSSASERESSASVSVPLSSLTGCCRVYGLLTAVGGFAFSGSITGRNPHGNNKSQCSVRESGPSLDSGRTW